MSYWILPTFHPAHILRKNRKLEGLLERDLKRAVGLSNGSWRPRWNEHGKGYKLAPTADEVVTILASMAGKTVAWDIETNGGHPCSKELEIRCCGFWDGTQGVCLPWLKRDGSFTEVHTPGKKKPVKRTNWTPYFGGAALVKVNAAAQRLFSSAHSLITQNGQFDRLCLSEKFGFVIPWGPPHFDTILAHHIVASYLPHGLDLLTSVYTDMPYYKSTEEGAAWSAASDRDLWTYAMRDCEATWRSAKKLKLEIAERAADTRLYKHDVRQEHECEEWKRAGIEVDEEAVLLFRQHYQGVAAKARERMKAIVANSLRAPPVAPESVAPESVAALEAIAGDVGRREGRGPERLALTAISDPLQALLTKLHAKGDEEEVDDLEEIVERFNPGSLIELRQLLLGIHIPLSAETSTGQLSTAEEFLLTARKELLGQGINPGDDRLAFLDALFAWRTAGKIESTYLRPELIPAGYVGVNGGEAQRIHPTFSVHVVPSGRLASKRPNFQNCPATIRGMFVARPGHVLVYIDWDALEMRLGAFLSGDRTFIEDFKKWDARTGPKIHVVNMCAIFGLERVEGVEARYPGCYRAAKVFAYSCFERNTRVALLNGSKPISGCRPGDWTWSWDGNRMVPTRVKAVILEGMKECLKLTVRDGPGERKTVIVTPTHPMMRRDGTYARVVDLRPDDRLMPFRRHWAAKCSDIVVSIEPMGKCEVWDLSVEHPAQNFPLSEVGVVVHNTAYGAGEATVYEQVRAEMPDMDFGTFKKIFAQYKTFRRRLFEFMSELVRKGTQNQYLDSPILERRVFFYEKVYGEDSPEASAMQNFPFQCYRGSMRVLTRKGYRRIDALCGKFQAWTGQGWAPAKVVKKGIVPLFRVELTNGIHLEVDGTHRFLVPTENCHQWQTTRELQKKIRVTLDVARPLDFGSGRGEGRAWLSGFYTGNGWSSVSRGDVTFIVGDSPARADGRRPRVVIPKILRILRDLHLYGKAADEEGCTRIRVYSSRGRKLQRLLGIIPEQKASTKRIPEWIWGSSRAERVEFLRGLLDADGCIGQGKEARLQLCQRELLQEVWLLARTCGVTGTIFGPFKADSAGRLAWVLCLSAAQSERYLGWGAGATVITSRSNVPSWVAKEALGERRYERCTSHQVLSSRIRRGGSVSPYTLMEMGLEHSELYDYAEVKRIVALPKREPVFTLMVEDPQHRYVGEGAIAKNSGGADVVGLANFRVIDRLVVPMREKLKPGEVLQQLAQIHDELLFEVPKRLVKEFSKKLKAIAEEPPGPAYRSWALPVSLGISRRWKPVKWTCAHCTKDLKSKVALELKKSTPVLSTWTGRCEVCKKVTEVEVMKRAVDPPRGYDDGPQGEAEKPLEVEAPRAAKRARKAG